MSINNTAAVWSEDTEEQFIILVRERPPLYDITEKLYANRPVKIHLWREIEEKLNISEDELKKRWNSLRTQYTRYKKLEAGSPGAQWTGRQQWILRRLQFLEPHTKKHEFIFSPPATREPDPPSDGAYSETCTRLPENSSLIEASFASLSDCTESTFREELQPDTSQHCSAPRTRKRSRRAHAESLSEESSNLMCTITKTLKSLASREDDAISTYCRLIEHRMRQLPQHLLPHFEHEVDNCFFKYYVQSLAEVKVEVKTEEED